MTKNLNRIKTIVSKLSYSRTELLAKGYRKLAGYPESGFSTEKEYKSYIRKNKGGDYFEHFMVALIQIRKDLTPHIATHNFYDVIHDLYIYGKVSEGTMQNTNATGCEWLPVTEGSLVGVKNKLRSGLYIKIGEYSDLSHLKQFVTRGGKLFKGYKQLIWGEKKYKRVKISPFADRNRRIVVLSKLSRKQLSEMDGGNSKYKSIQIGAIISNEGYEKVDSDVIRNIMHTSD